MDDTASGLIDQDGRPIPRSVIASMRQEISGTDAIDGRPPFSGHFATRMRPELLGGIIRAADSGSSLEWRIVQEEIEELYPHYHAVLSKRRRQVCQLPITVSPAADDPESKKHAEFVEDWLETGVLQDALFDITDAIGKGASVSEIVWETAADCVRPKGIIFREARFFEISWHDGETIWLRTGAAKADRETMGGFAELAPHKFIQHRHKSKSGLTIRAGLTRSVAFLWMYAMFTLRDWALFTQSYGMPIRVGRYGPEASQSDRNILWRAVSSIAGDVAAIIPKSMEIEFSKDTDRRAGSELYEKRLDWLDRTVSKVVLGGTAGTDAIAGGHAVGRQHRAVEQDIERFDAGLLSTTLLRQVVHPSVAFTFGPQLRYPILHIGQPDQVPLNEFTQGVAAFVPLGLKVRAREVRERLGLTAPEPQDELLSNPAAAADAAGGGAGKLLRVAIPDDPDSDMQSRRFLGRLLSLQAEQSPELVERLADRLAGDAAGALAGMTETVRHAFDQASDMRDLAHRLSRLDLPQKAFAEAMARGMALAHLAGQAELLAEAGIVSPSGWK
jgi:phage gp29-like protein